MYYVCRMWFVKNEGRMYCEWKVNYIIGENIKSILIQSTLLD